MTRYLADTSAWHWSGRVANRWSELIEDDALALCTPVKLELLFSAHGGSDYRELEEDLRGFVHLPIDARVEEEAAQAQRLLAARSQHRGPTPTDLLIAAIANVNEMTLLHHDRHFDVIARATGQDVEWLARRGTLR